MRCLCESCKRPVDCGRRRCEECKRGGRAPIPRASDADETEDQ